MAPAFGAGGTIDMMVFCGPLGGAGLGAGSRGTGGTIDIIVFCPAVTGLPHLGHATLCPAATSTSARQDGQATFKPG
jgi:hypothetical protein